MRIGLLSLTVLVAVLTAGCYHVQEWGHAHGDTARYHRDNYECKRENQRSSFIGAGGVAVGGSDLDDGLYVDCMKARGYVLREP